MDSQRTDATPRTGEQPNTAPSGTDGATDGEERAGSTAAQLVELALALGIELFRTPEDVAYVRVPHDDGAEVLKVHGARFPRLLREQFFEATRKPVNNTTMTTALLTLEALATSKSAPVRPVYRRVAPGPNGALVIDLCGGRQVVTIQNGKWEVHDQTSIMFTRSSGMYPLPVPVRGGNLTELRELLNLPSDDDWLFVVAWLAAAYRPTGPYALLHIRGEQGTAKSTTARMVRRLVDPNKTDLRSPPRREQDIVVSTGHAWSLAFDNVSSIAPQLSDALCRVATGGGFGTRQLYTNDEETTFEFKRSMLITSIANVIDQPDLADRTLAVELVPIPDHERRDEQRLWDVYEEARPRIFGAMLDVVAQALALLPGVVAENRPAPRMKDFADFGEAVARALGEKPGRFLDLLMAARVDTGFDAIEGSPVVGAFLEWIRTVRKFTGTHKKLLSALNAAAGSAARQSEWPRTPKGLSTQLVKYAPNLERCGVIITKTKQGHGHERVLTATYQPPESGQPSASSASVAGATNTQAPRADGADGTARTKLSPVRLVPVPRQGRTGTAGSGEAPRPLGPVVLVAVPDSNSVARDEDE